MAVSNNDTEIKEKIEEAIAKTKAQVDEYKELTKPVAPDVAIGRISRMDAINNKSVNEAALRQAQHKLNQLQKVLANFGKPGFGHCRKCGDEIPLARILYRPESLHCVNCAR